MKVAFWDNQLQERGTSVSLYDYALYNSVILGNESYIFSQSSNSEVLQKFKMKFTVHILDGFHEVDSYLLKHSITHIYIIKSGERDRKISKVAKNCIHCVFKCHEPHGEVYSSISPGVAGNNGKYPVVPHMINLPRHDNNMREKLGIPGDAVVFGGYGGRNSFSIPFVREVVCTVAKNNPHIYFLFANFVPLGPDLPNLIHLPTIVGLAEKVEFINTCDAMLWAQGGGETFGLAIGEFSTLNKPVIATKNTRGGKTYVQILGDKAMWYANRDDLAETLLSFDPAVESKKDWNAYREYTPEKVMAIFKKTYLDSSASPPASPQPPPVESTVAVSQD